MSGLILPDSKPGQVLDAIRRGEVQAVSTWELARELIDVLDRPRLRRYGFTDDDVRDVLLLLAPFLPRVDVQTVPGLRDPSDSLVIGAAISGEVDGIVTGDRDLLHGSVIEWLAQRNIHVLTPSALLETI